MSPDPQLTSEHLRRSRLRQEFLRNSPLRKESTLKFLYGIDTWRVVDMYIEQDEACAICKQHFPIYLLEVDHEHNARHRSRFYRQLDRSLGLIKVRGLLCGNCNRGLGLFLDNPSYLARAIEYLQRAKAGKEQ